MKNIWVCTSFKSYVIQALGRNDRTFMLYVLKYFILLGLKTVTGLFMFICLAHLGKHMNLAFHKIIHKLFHLRSLHSWLEIDKNYKSYLGCMQQAGRGCRDVWKVSIWAFVFSSHQHTRQALICLLYQHNITYNFKV